MSLRLIHTADVHCATFEALRDLLAPEAVLDHVVRPDWLTRAQAGEDLRSELTEQITDRTLCTCTTLGPLAEELGALRIDQPMMAEAAQMKGAILMAFCLESTRGPSLTLLEQALASAGRDAHVHTLLTQDLWPLFERGLHADFLSGIADRVRNEFLQLDDVGCVVLAQASMAGAAEKLQDLGIPVLSSPELALRAALSR